MATATCHAVLVAIWARRGTAIPALRVPARTRLRGAIAAVLSCRLQHRTRFQDAQCRRPPSASSRDDGLPWPTRQTSLLPGAQSLQNSHRRMLRQNFESPTLSRGRIARIAAGTHKLNTTHELFGFLERTKAYNNLRTWRIPIYNLDLRPGANTQTRLRSPAPRPARRPAPR